MKQKLPDFLKSLMHEYHETVVFHRANAADGECTFTPPPEFAFLKHTESMTDFSGPDPEYPGIPFYYAMCRDADGRGINVLVQGVVAVSPVTYDLSTLSRCGLIKVTFFQAKSCGMCGIFQANASAKKAGKKSSAPQPKLRYCKDCYSARGHRFFICGDECKSQHQQTPTCACELK